MQKGKQPEKHINMPTPGARGDVTGLEFDARRLQRLKTVELLRSGRTPLQLVKAADHAAELADQSIRTVQQRQPPRPGPACREGCAWCCHKRVGVSAIEVCRIVAYLRANLTTGQLQELTARVGEADENRRSLAGDRWAAVRLRCPLLVEERCSVYPVRPLTCRGFNSSDARRCERSITNRAPVEVPIYEPQLRVATFILDGINAGAAEAGLSAELLELTGALRIALELPNVADRWLAGEPVFAPAKMP